MIDPKQVFSFIQGVQIGENVHLNENAAHSVEWTVPDKIPYVDGHFPGHPVLPGVALVDCSYEFIKSIVLKQGRSLDGNNYEIRLAKFANIVSPGMRVMIKASAKSDSVWAVEWSSDGQACASLEFAVRLA